MSLKRQLISQFHKPTGGLGRVAGWLMATRRSNLERNLWTVKLLNIKQDDHVLELGPGPGVTLGLLTNATPKGLVVGLDHSATMLTACGGRNQKAVRDGRLKLVQGSFLKLPALPGPFDKIIAVNSLQFDGTNIDTLARITGLLKTGGTIAITFQPRGADANNSKALAFGDKIAEMYGEIGLKNIQIEKLLVSPVCAVCVMASSTR